MKNTTPDKSLPVAAWNWPCADETLESLPQFKTSPRTELAEQFWNGLSRSLSLSIDEKLRVIDEVPNLSTHQFQALNEVWRDEQKKFQKLLEEDFSGVSKLIGTIAIEWLLIWEKLELKKDDQNVGVIWQFVDIFYSGGSVPEFESYVKNSYFWLGCIEAMNKHDGHSKTIDRALTILEHTLNDSNFGFIPKISQSKDVISATTELIPPLTSQ